MKLIMLRGLPASGKSTYAKELVKEGYVRTNKDELRKLLHGNKWSSSNENQVLEVRDAIISAALSRGRNVVCDDTNFHPPHEEALRELAGKYKAEFEIKSFDADVAECIKRDLHRGESAVGERVIRRMWRQYIAPVQERYVNTLGAKAALFDIDGTLAVMGKRSPSAWKEVGIDGVNAPVRDLLLMMQADYKILVFSGRDSICRSETEEWLALHGIRYSELHMRPEGDMRKDVEVKREFYDVCKERYDIIYAVDDRPQVCRLWHELGLTLLKVGDPDAEF